MSGHPVKAFLSAHEAAFRARYGQKPARYTAKDAKHAKDLLADYGQDGALVMLTRFFASADAFIARSGHGLGVLASGTVQNKLIAEASGVLVAVSVYQRAAVSADPWHQREKMAEVARLMAGGMSKLDAYRRVGW